MSFTDDTPKPKPRLLTISESCRCHPRITISGDWLCDWGFSIGDPISLLCITTGIILIKIGVRENTPDISSYIVPCDVPKMVIRNPPSYRLYPGPRYCPQFILTGAWLRNWGFDIDNRISLTKIDDDYIIMKVVTPASEWRPQLQKRQLEHQVKVAKAALNRHNASQRQKARRKPTTAAEPTAELHRLAPLQPEAA